MSDALNQAEILLQRGDAAGALAALTRAEQAGFPAPGLKVRGRTGDGLLFRNASPEGRPDERALHAGLPVTKGVKHLASRWIRAAPLILD